MNKNFLEAYQIKPVAPIGTDLNTAALVGARVSPKNFDRVAIVIEVGASTAAVAEFNLVQHNAATGGVSKPLATQNPYYKKVGTADVWTKVQPTVDTSTYTVTSDFAAAAGMICFEILGEDLDVDGGFTHVSLGATDSNAAKIVNAYYVLGNPRFGPAYKTETI